MKINMRTTAAVVAALTLAVSAASAEGFYVAGDIRSGIEFGFGDDAKVVSTSDYHDGNYYGNGNTRLRLNFKYENGDAGAVFRYEHKAGKAWFDEGNAKYAMGYAKLFDGILVAEAGKLKDLYTGSDGQEGYGLTDIAFAGAYGAGFTLLPVDGLAVQAIVSDGLGKGFEARKDNFTFGAKYANDVIKVAGGYNLSGKAFGYVGIGAVENLGVDLEVYYEQLEDKDDIVEINEDINYDLNDSLSFGLLAYQKLGGEKDSKPVFEFNPHVMFGIDDTFIVSAESYITVPTAEDSKVAFSVTPALWINVKKAKVNVYYTYDNDGENSANYVGTGVKVSF